MQNNKKFYNEDRSRYYGVRVGDYVREVHKANPNADAPELREPWIKVEGYVTEWGFMDNNCVGVTPKDGGKIVSCVAEWLTILIPVETWFPGKPGGSIVTLDPYNQPETSQESLDAYGGYVIAESIPTPFINLICAAPALLKAVNMLEELDNTGQINLWSNKRTIYNQALRIVRHGYNPIDFPSRG